MSKKFFDMRCQALAEEFLKDAGIQPDSITDGELTKVSLAREIQSTIESFIEDVKN